MMKPQILVWGRPKGETDAISETLLAETCQTEADVEKVKAAASADGWHTFRVSTFDGSPPDFTKVLNTGTRRRR